MSTHEMAVRKHSVPQALTVTITYVWWLNEDGDRCHNFQRIHVDGELPNGYTHADLCEDAADTLRS